MKAEIKRRLERAAMNRWENRFIQACDALLKSHKPNWKKTGKTYSQAWHEFVPEDERQLVNDLKERYRLFHA